MSLLPERLRKLGYSTHGFGKWHLGFCSPGYTPRHRGFDTFEGLYTGDLKAKAEKLGVELTRRQRREVRFSAMSLLLFLVR